MSDTSVDPAQVAEPPRPGVLLKIWTHRLVFWIGLAVIAGGAAHYRFIEGSSTSDVLHVALLAAVLFVEFIMLGRMRRETLERAAESQLRSRVMIDLDNFRIALSRAYYLQELERGIRDARAEILFTTATMASSADPHQRRIVQAVKEKEAEIERRGGKLVHQGIVAKLPSCLPGAVELACKTRTEVRFRAYFGYTRLRFQVTDHSFSVIGVVEGEPAFDHVASTHRSFSVESMLLAEALRDRFNQEWAASQSVWEYLDEHIRDMLGAGPAEDSAITQEHMLRLLKADDTGVTADEIAARSVQFRRLPTEAQRRARARVAPLAAGADPVEPAEPLEPGDGGATPKRGP
jgi:hypothetical protein